MFSMPPGASTRPRSFRNTISVWVRTVSSTFRCRAVIVVMFTTGGALRLPANVAVWITRCDSKLSVHHLVSMHVKDDICARTTLVITYASTF